MEYNLLSSQQNDKTLNLYADDYYENHVIGNMKVTNKKQCVLSFVSQVDFENMLIIKLMISQHTLITNCVNFMQVFWNASKQSNPVTDFRRQNLTSMDVRFWLLKSIPSLKE